jgi:hypothetical protein
MSECPGMTAVPVEAELLRELLGRRDDLVQAIAAGMESGNWDAVMGPFDSLLLAIKRLEASLAGSVNGLGLGTEQPPSADAPEPA